MTAINSSVAYPIESVGNALRLIHILRETDALRITDIARELGVAPSTAHRLMTMLVQYGFAEQNSSRTYQRGWAMPDNPTASTTEVVVAHARPSLLSLSRRIGETVHLVRRKGTAAVFVDGVESNRRHVVHVRSRAGISMLAHSTAAGKAILAKLAPSDIAVLYPRGLPQTYGPGPRDLSTLNRQLARIRRRGFSINDEESERGLIGIAVGLEGGENGGEWAVATGIPLSRCPDLRIPELAHELTTTAVEIAKCMEDPSWSGQQTRLIAIDGSSA